ncbi:MAG TPA: type II toxin-antitoxin system HicA family toxin [Dyella sp.]|uniref:type II toxin-antitoxin system HicA family toxin n=1 Tax=Dyella sp. TaxID=1869338 RepID=UPI002C69BF25|nr:type II toxin-antitoxin system HicA family toxin [Dyella sp.]HUB92231.1 type II toxin-antitoxin system HicA family toxin [Dyella sp.]
MIAKYAINTAMKAKHRRTLESIYATPTLGSVIFAEVEALIVALGGDIREGNGSRVVFELAGSRIYLHRPHPGKEAKKYQVEELRKWLIEKGIHP